eukprot:superscaffoldBa00003055_g15991
MYPNTEAESKVGLKDSSVLGVNSKNKSCWNSKPECRQSSLELQLEMDVCWMDKVTGKRVLDNGRGKQRTICSQADGASTLTLSSAPTSAVKISAAVVVSVIGTNSNSSVTVKVSSIHG